MGIFTLFSTNFNYFYPFPFLCPKIQLIHFFFATQTAGTNHTHYYDIYFPRDTSIQPPARPSACPPHPTSTSMVVSNEYDTNASPPHGQLPSSFDIWRLLQSRRQLQCQVGYPLPKNSSLSSAENSQKSSHHALK